MRTLRTVVPAALLALALMACITGVTTIATSGSAVAQTATSSTARMATDADAVTTSGSPVNRTGTWVFLGVCGVIGGVALVLFLNHRRTKQD